MDLAGGSGAANGARHGATASGKWLDGASSPWIPESEDSLVEAGTATIPGAWMDIDPDPQASGRSSWHKGGVEFDDHGKDNAAPLGSSGGGAGGGRESTEGGTELLILGTRVVRASEPQDASSADGQPMVAKGRVTVLQVRDRADMRRYVITAEGQSKLNTGCDDTLFVTVICW